MKTIFQKIRAALKASTSFQDLQAALASTEREIPGLELAVADAEAARTDMLIAGTDLEIDKADDAVRIARRELDRALATRTELARRASAANAAERKTEIDAQRSAIAGRADDLAERLRAWPELQRQAVALIHELCLIEEEVAAFNAEEIRRGGTEYLLAVEPRVFRPPASQYGPLYSIARTTIFAPIGNVPGWPSYAEKASVEVIG